MAQIGINVPGRGEHSPDEIASTGATMVRLVAYSDTDITAWLNRCGELGLQAILILGSECLGGDEGRWTQVIHDFGERYGARVAWWQIGNECDAAPNAESSWNMSQSKLNRLFRIARQTLPQARLLGPGLCSGQPRWAESVEWERVDALAFHPYGKNPGAWWRGADWGTGEIEPLLQGYRAIAEQYRKPLFITEFGWQSVGDGGIPEDVQADYYGTMLRTLAPDSRIEAVLPFCYHDYRGFGLFDGSRRKPVFGAFQQAAGGPRTIPSIVPSRDQATPPPRRELVAGFKKFHDLLPEVIGEPLEAETGAWVGQTIQRTSHGWLTWSDLRSGPALTFLHDDGRRFRWKEDWPAPEQLP